MANLTRQALVELLNNAKWAHAQNDHGIHTEINLEGGSFSDRELEYYDADKEEMVFIVEYQGGVDVTSSIDGLTIIYQRGYWYENRSPSDIALYDFEQADKWLIEGDFIGEDGEPLFESSEDIAAFMEEHAPSAFSNIDTCKLIAV
ncbi:hypothetical protein [Pseudoalteromonas galatheae]|uniref:hypothetical protein n=1 Tax=Pseudoalteromonas galatheae TaxID=579562 RepID=UPI0030CFCE4B